MEQIGKKLPELKKESTTFKLVIPKEVEEKIRHLCRCCPTVEWSGKLFYKTEGSIANKDLVITCIDIYVMDIGSSTYTEFEESPDYFGYMVDKDLMECNIGLVHSHQNFSTFFSGTDLSTLQEEGNDNNHFVSLIVNNAGKYTAAVTRKITSFLDIVATKSYRTFDDSTVTIDEEDKWQETEETIEYFMLDIDKEEVPSVFNELDARLNEIRTAKAKKEEEKRNKTTAASTINKPWYAHDRFDDDYSFLGKKWNQPTLFDEEELKTKTEPKPLKQKDEVLEDFDGLEPKISEECVDNIIAQLVTGSILINKSSNLDIDKFVSNMESLFDKRFKGDTDLYFFSEWAENFIEFLFLENIPDGLPVEIEQRYVVSLAQALLSKLYNYVPNKYLDEIITALEYKAE